MRLFEIWFKGEKMFAVAESSIAEIVSHFVCFVDMPSGTVILW